MLYLNIKSIAIKYIKLVKGPDVAPVINSSENDIIIFGNVLFGAKLEHLLHQA